MPHAHRQSAALAATAVLASVVLPADPAAGAPAAPAPAPACAPAYAAEAGAQALGIHRLGGDTALDVRIAETRTGVAAPGSAATARPLGGTDGPDALTTPVTQTAPPQNPAATTRGPATRTAGPFTLRRATTSAHARWTPGLTCGTTTGPVTRAEARLGAAQAGDLLRAPAGLAAWNTTELARRGNAVHSVATAAVEPGTLRILDGAATVTIVRGPHLTAAIAPAKGTARVDYRPPVVEVTAPGTPPKRLTTPGATAEIPLDDRTESALLGALPALATVGGVPLPGMPPLPGVPTLPSGRPESAPAPDGTTLRVTLGTLKQATQGQAVAARAVAVRLEIVGPGRDKQGYAHPALDADFGVLEAAAVAPLPPSARAAAAAPEGGQGAGLPVTGTSTGAVAGVGLTLLAAGLLLVGWTTRRRRTT
ncbi:hypothetical protein [Spirilliplanes yamanashiensis]|uniref:Gram-positive cocci surface proteins LPxTG domain-containing protein n=1 Tax=Spirilliplanes yamanashiensis TaxID=42233 RepID=A0A8J4DK64_9ACTN|nr:hypothetical protein [Spirilliplanes yamanashiensis]MDP9815481.1 hypothetical protein [Spirilliplanes yamanashiensis]GIJ03735.1 hypothetical protein Sya03_30870 [Spirilliplanes yamanashiensis]